MMTVYNRVISHAALQTLDVLAIGMLSLFVFELMLRALRGHVASHTGARLDVAIGGEVVHRLLQPTLPRLRGGGQRRPGRAGPSARPAQKLSHWSAAAASCRPRLCRAVRRSARRARADLAWLTVAAMPLFVLLSAVAHRRQRTLGRVAAGAATQKAACLGEAVGQALTVKGLGLEPAMERRFERRLVDSAWASFRAGSLTNLVGSLGQALQHLTALGVVYLGARQIVAGDLSIGALVAANILSGRALAPMRQVFCRMAAGAAGAGNPPSPRRGAGRTHRGSAISARTPSGCAAGSASRPSRSAMPRRGHLRSTPSRSISSRAR